MLQNTFWRNAKIRLHYGNPVVDSKQRKRREKERKYNERVIEIESAIHLIIYVCH